MMGLFDRNGNGLLSRSDFTKAIKALKLKISIKKK
jgi:Ca2+-binding EF-hand superfamily protein